MVREGVRERERGERSQMENSFGLINFYNYMTWRWCVLKIIIKNTNHWVNSYISQRLNFDVTLGLSKGKMMTWFKMSLLVSYVNIFHKLSQMTSNKKLKFDLIWISNIYCMWILHGLTALCQEMNWWYLLQVLFLPQSSTFFHCN